MKRTTRRAKIDWTTTPQGQRKYESTRAQAQARANELGMDQGIERNDLFQEFITFGLPRAENRRGFELRCEVVHPEDLTKCQPGHGP